VAGLAQAFGSGAMTNSIAEIGDASVIMAVGTNTTSGHPIIGQQVRAAKRKGSKLIVVNPKEIDLARTADHFLRLRPGTDVPLLMGMARVILDEGLYDKSFVEERCDGFDAFVESLAAFDLDSVEKVTGVPKDAIAAAARCYASGQSASILYCMGVTQHVQGTDNVLAVSNLAMLTGNLGKPSSGVNPLRGQNNVQGACDMGCLPNVYTGYQPVASKEVKAKFESAWDCKLSLDPGLTHTEIFDRMYSGSIKALYLVGENPYISEANSSHAVEAMEKVEFMVVQDIFLTESARYADVILPASSFAEKDGTFTNTERRVQRVRRVIEPVGDSRPDWSIVCDIAKRMDAKGFDFSDPAEIMQEIASVTPSYGGITFKRLEYGGLQWPCPTEDHPGTPILHTERFPTDTGRGKFKPLAYRKSAEEPDEQYPLILTTDRSLYHFHGTMTRRVYGLNILEKEEMLRINPEDAARFGLTDKGKARVTSRHGTVDTKVLITDKCPPGMVSMTFHFAETPTNIMTCSELDPVAKTPTTKVCTVRVESVA
jgi:formate dehydrogenase alpha subunit